GADAKSYGVPTEHEVLPPTSRPIVVLPRSPSVTGVGCDAKMVVHVSAFSAATGYHGDRKTTYGYESTPCRSGGIREDWRWDANARALRSIQRARLPAAIRATAQGTFPQSAAVTLPPGRLRLATKPSLTGSPPLANTIGIVVVAALAASTAGVAGAAITVT